MNKLAKRKAMKKLAILQAQSAAIGMFIDLQRSGMHPLMIVAASAANIEHLRAAVSYVGGLPAEWFRPDQPKIDPRRKKRFGYRGYIGVIDHARPGGDRTALAYLRGREVVQIIHDEVTTK